jgi:predicted phosphodiesterase
MRLAIITDIHEDLPGLQKTIKKAENAGYDQLVCLGDISGYSLPYYKHRGARSASGCLDLIREKCAIIIPGNHDLHAARKLPEGSLVFDFPDNWYDLDAQERARLAGGKIWTHGDDLCPGFSYDDLEFIRGLPEFEIMEAEDFRIMFSHYAFPNLSGFARGFFTFDKDFKAHFRFMKQQECLLSFIGHAHHKGFYQVMPHDFRHIRQKKARFEGVPTIFGLPPVTRRRRRRAYCIFDCNKLEIREYR